MTLSESFGDGIAESNLKTRLNSEAGAVIALIGGNSLEVFPLGAGLGADTAVEIGSLTKVFTALLFADALGRQELQYDTRIDQLLFGETWTGLPAIGAGQLATHTSGLPRLSMSAQSLPLHPRDPYSIYDRKHLLDYLRENRPRVPETPQVNYSNFGYAVLGLMLEKAASKSYEELLRQRLLVPLGMGATSLQFVGTKDRPTPGSGANGRPASLWHWDGYTPCGAMVSTINDLVLTVRAFLDCASPVAKALEASLQPRAPMPGGNMGLGWVLPASGNSFWHNGATAGYTSYLGVCMLRKTGIVIVANQALPKEATELGHQLIRLVAEQQEGPLG
jgi:D-alanyl-D-alanine-carboxypeptidase/D-alanyl-D-alanine-endopeptidase